jgi:ABC-type oligopeptide transport system substrate-binding subunit
MKKLFGLLLSLLLVFGLFACGNDQPGDQGDDGDDKKEVVVPESNLSYNYIDTEGLEGYALESAQIYNQVFGQFAQTYKSASSAQSVSEKYALQAIAEAKLLETGAILPGEGNGGSYAVSRIAPGTVPSVFWGLDNNKVKHLLVVSQPEGQKVAITKEQRDELKADWIAADSASAYRASAKAKLEGWGYTLKDSYTALFNTDPYTWDVLADYHAATSEPLCLTFDFLVEYDAKNVIQPALAKSIPAIQTAEDGTKSMTFEIRDNAKWVDKDGNEIAPVTGDDFVCGYEHMLTSHYFDELVEGLIKSVTADGNKVTYTFENGADTSYFLTMLSYSPFAPLNRAYFTSEGNNYGTGFDHILYCGAYRIKSFVSKNTFEFVANDKYWDKDNVDIKNITWLFTDGSDATFAYKQFEAGITDSCGLNTAALALAKTEAVYNAGIYTTSVDGNTYPFWFNGNRKAYISDEGTSTELASQKTDAQKHVAETAMANVYFRLALAFGIDRVAYEATQVSPELAAISILNSYTPAELVFLAEDVTVKINGKDTTFKAGQYYGEIMQAQLDADGYPMQVWMDKETAESKGINVENARGTGHGFDGWYNVDNCRAYLAKALEQIQKALYDEAVAAGKEDAKLEDYKIDKSNPVVLELPYIKTNTVSLLSNKALARSIEASTDGAVVVNLIAGNGAYALYDAAYFNNYGYEANVDISKISGWGPDYGDPKTYLDTFLNGQGGMVKNFGIY